MAQSIYCFNSFLPDIPEVSIGLMWNFNFQNFNLTWLNFRQVDEDVPALSDDGRSGANFTTRLDQLDSVNQLVTLVTLHKGKNVMNHYVEPNLRSITNKIIIDNKTFWPLSHIINNCYTGFPRNSR